MKNSSLDVNDIFAFDIQGCRDRVEAGALYYLILYKS
jgi:hypothetical protein